MRLRDLNLYFNSALKLKTKLRILASVFFMGSECCNFFWSWPVPFVAVSSCWFHLVACRSDRAPEAGEVLQRARRSCRSRGHPQFKNQFSFAKRLHSHSFNVRWFVRSIFSFFFFWIFFYIFFTRIFQRGVSNVYVCVFEGTGVCECAIGSLTLEWTFIQFAKQPQAAQ